MSVASVEAEGMVRYDGAGPPVWSPDARWVAVPCEGDRVAVLDDASREEVVVHPLGGPLRALRWTSPDHLLVVVTLRGRAVARLLEMPDGGAVAETVLFQGERFAIDVSVDGRALWIAPRWSGQRLGRRYAVWLEHPSLERRTSLDVLDVACRAAGLARDRTYLMEHSAMDPEGHRVAIPIRHQSSTFDARVSVVVVQLGGAGAIAGRQIVAPCGRWNDATVVRWVGRDALLVSSEVRSSDALVWRVVLDERNGSAAAAIFGTPTPNAASVSFLQDLDLAGEQALLRWGYAGNDRLQRVSLGARGAISAIASRHSPHSRIDRWRPDSVLSLGDPLGRLKLRRASLHDDGAEATDLWTSSGDSADGLDVLPNDRGVLLSLHRRGRRVWLCLDAERLRGV